MRLLAPLFAAALALLTACSCEQPGDSTPTAVDELPAAELYAEYVPADDGTFQALARLSPADGRASRCLELREEVAVEVGGVALPRGEMSSTAASCTCRQPTFIGKGTAPAAATDGTFTVKDETGDLSATVVDLFVAPAVAIEDPAGAPISALRRSSRVYLAFSPANVAEMKDVTLTFTAASASTPAFTLTNANGGGIVKDGERWAFEVPASAAAGSGVLAVKTLARLETSSCTAVRASDPLACYVLSLATRQLTTSIE